PGRDRPAAERTKTGECWFLRLLQGDCTMRLRSRCIFALFIVSAALYGPCAQGQSASANPRGGAQVLLTVRGAGKAPVSLTEADLKRLTSHEVKVKGTDGGEVVYSGVLMGDVLQRAGVDFAQNLHGRGLTRYLLVEAADKYRI